VVEITVFCSLHSNIVNQETLLHMKQWQAELGVILWEGQNKLKNV
jgi:hypothetical protein